MKVSHTDTSVRRSGPREHPSCPFRRLGMSPWPAAVLHSPARGESSPWGNGAWLGLGLPAMARAELEELVATGSLGPPAAGRARGGDRGRLQPGLTLLVPPACWSEVWREGAELGAGLLVIFCSFLVLLGRSPSSCLFLVLPVHSFCFLSLHLT